MARNQFKPKVHGELLIQLKKKINHIVRSQKPGSITTSKVNYSSRNIASGFSFYSYTCFWLRASLRSWYLLSWHLWYLHCVHSFLHQSCHTWPWVVLLFSSKGTCCSSSEHGERAPAAHPFSINTGGPCWSGRMRPNPCCLSAKLMILIMHRNWVTVIDRAETPLKHQPGFSCQVQAAQTLQIFSGKSLQKDNNLAQIPPKW